MDGGRPYSCLPCPTQPYLTVFKPTQSYPIRPCSTDTLYPPLLISTLPIFTLPKLTRVPHHPSRPDHTILQFTIPVPVPTHGPHPRCQNGDCLIDAYRKSI